MDKTANSTAQLREKYEDLLAKYSPVVMGEGAEGAHIFMIGEAPGKWEVEKGRPFVGQAGKNLDEFLEMLELERKDIYITNAVKFRPVKKMHAPAVCPIGPPPLRKLNCSALS